MAQRIKTKLDVDPDKEPEHFNQMILEAVLEDDILWAYHMQPYIRAEDDVYKFMSNAPSPGAVSMLFYAWNNRKDFFSNHVTKALGRKRKEARLVDDGRKNLERIDQAVAFFNERAKPKRKRSRRNRGRTEPAVLSSGSEGPATKP